MEKSELEKYEQLLILADEVADRAHQGQLDKSGVPYIEHPRKVCRLVEAAPLPESVANPEVFRLQAMIVALLHDVCEDSELTLADLQAQGFPQPILQAVDLMTHRPEDSYQQYIERLRPNLLARTVKLQDLKHNSDPSRLKEITEPDRRRFEKYAAARNFLLEA